MKTVSYHTTTTLDNYKDMTPPHTHVWEWATKNPNGDVHIIEEGRLTEHMNYNGIKIACILETPAVYEAVRASFNPFQWIAQNHQPFQYVMSPFRFLKDVVGEDKYLYVPVGGSRIELDSFGMWEKSRLLSMVASHKTWTEGHRLRHTVVKRYPGKMDAYGSGYNNIINEYNGHMGKIISIAPYHFTFAIMNSVYDDYFTEVITDAFAVGTIPIWWGTKNIGKYFNSEGILQFETLEKLDTIMDSLTPELYQSKLAAVEENIELAKKYISHFNWIHDTYRVKFENL